MPIAHWMWGGGWLAKMGALDFAGGTVVHVNCGMAALALVLILGTRKNAPSTTTSPWIFVIGTGLLWFGWFGFNAGSALGATNLAVSAMIVTNIAACVGMLTWMLIEALKPVNQLC